MKDKRQRSFALCFALLGAILLSPPSYFLGRELSSGDTVASTNPLGNNEVAIDQMGAGALAAWVGGILGILVGGRIGSDYALSLRRRDQIRARREKYAHVIEEYERNRSDDPDVDKDEERRKSRKRRRNNFSPWP